ncbi:MAG: mannose-6-phosphate isomerase [Bacteroidetes bacterium 4572_77]|nr:MAG: mannose-6-phosphate isomerase [Bacteroidetes bacterium 4572_77]
MENKLYPMTFKPIFREKIWGGQKIDKFGNVFPLLIKILDAEDWLSIQVHPDDALAKKRGLGGGKTEMWYILDAEKDSKLIAGFSEKVNENVYLRKIEDKKLPEIMNFESVEKEDVFYMPSGRVHALGPGVLLAEIQQTSDTTYRIYDWERLDDQGKGRELHLKEAMEAIDFDLHDSYKTDYQAEENKTSPIINTPFFTTNVLWLKEHKSLQKDYSDLDSFVILLAIEGAFDYEDLNGKKGRIKAGESMLIPASLMGIKLLSASDCKLLEVYILPQKKND